MSTPPPESLICVYAYIFPNCIQLERAATCKRSYISPLFISLSSNFDKNPSSILNLGNEKCKKKEFRITIPNC